MLQTGNLELKSSSYGKLFISHLELSRFIFPNIFYSNLSAELCEYLILSFINDDRKTFDPFYDSVVFCPGLKKVLDIYIDKKINNIPDLLKLRSSSPQLSFDMLQFITLAFQACIKCSL